MVPFVTTLLSTMLPTGVFGQYSLVWRGGSEGGRMRSISSQWTTTTMTMPSDSAVKPASASRTVTACRRFIVNSFRLGTSRQADRDRTSEVAFSTRPHNAPGIRALPHQY